MASMTIKEAFQKLSKVTNAGIKNPWFVIRNLGQTFADVADNVVDAGGSTVEVDPIVESGTKIATISVDDDDYDLYAPSSSTIDVSDKITAHTGVVLSDGFVIRAFKIGNIVFLDAGGAITSGSAAAGTLFDLLDIDESLTPIQGATCYCFGTDSSNRRATVKTSGSIEADCGAWCRFEVFWFIA